MDVVFFEFECFMKTKSLKKWALMFKNTIHTRNQKITDALKLFFYLSLIWALKGSEILWFYVLAMIISSGYWYMLFAGEEVDICYQ